MAGGSNPFILPKASTGTAAGNPFAAKPAAATSTTNPFSAGYKPAPAAPPKSSHSGGFFADLLKTAEGLPGDFARGSEKVAQVASGLGQAGYDLGKVVYEGDKGVVTGNNQAIDKANAQLGKEFVHPIAQSYAKKYGPAFQGHLGETARNIVHDPVGTFLDAATVLTLGGAGAAKAGSLLEKAGAITQESRLARLGKPVDLTAPDYNGESVVIKQSSTNPVIRTRQVATNKMLNALPPTTPVVGSDARVLKAISRPAERAGARVRVNMQPFQQAFGRLSKPERAAWHIAARGVTPEEWKGLLLAQPGSAPVSSAFLKQLDNPKVRALVEQPSKNLQRALDLGRQLSDQMTAQKVAAGHISEAAAAESPYRLARLVRGAKIVPAEAGEPSPALRRAVQTRDSLQAQHEAALAKETEWLGKLREQIRRISETKPAFMVRHIPMTEETAQARLAELDKQHDELVQKLIPEVSPYGGNLSRAEQLRRNFENSRAGKGNRIGAKRMPTVKSEEYQLAADKLREIADTNAGNPTADRLANLLNERDSLRSLINQRGGAAIFGEKPAAFPIAETRIHHGEVPVRYGGPSLPLDNPYRERIVTLGHALDQAERRVAQLTRDLPETGVVGGKPIEQIAHELDQAGRPQPFYVPDSAVTEGSSGYRFRSRPTGLAEPGAGGSAKRNLGRLVQTGHVNLHGDALSHEVSLFARRLIP